MTTELAFIESLRRLAGDPGARGFDDDCAVIAFGGNMLVLTYDAMAEGVHFPAGHDPADVAWKLVSVNLSDLAAKGAEPLGLLLGYVLGEDDARFVEGLEDALSFYDVPLLGGDTIAAKGPRTLGITALGKATHVPVPSRAGAREGDLLYLTGPVGGAMMGFEALQAGSGDTGAYCRPIALLGEGKALAPLVSAMMDVSDGLLLDAYRLAEASGLTLDIDTRSVPIAAPEHRRDAALRWGDDYKLLFTAAPETELPPGVHRIGKAIARTSSPLRLDGEPVSGTEELGYEH